MNEAAEKPNDHVSIGNEFLQFKTTKIAGKQSTGKDLLEAYGVLDLDKHLIFQWLHDGALESLRLEESAKEEPEGMARFIVFESSESYRFEIDDRRLEWGTGRIKGRVLKLLVGLDPDEYAVWKENDVGDDDEIGNDDWASLSSSGLERFFTGRQETTEG